MKVVEDELCRILISGIVVEMDKAEIGFWATKSIFSKKSVTP
jgi:hypothetical protein